MKSKLRTFVCEFTKKYEASYGRNIWKILFNEAIAMKRQKQSSGYYVKKVFWKFLQNSQENTCAGVYF